MLEFSSFSFYTSAISLKRRIVERVVAAAGVLWGGGRLVFLGGGVGSKGERGEMIGRGEGKGKRRGKKLTKRDKHPPQSSSCTLDNARCPPSGASLSFCRRMYMCICESGYRETAKRGEGVVVSFWFFFGGGGICFGSHIHFVFLGGGGLERKLRCLFNECFLGERG